MIFPTELTHAVINTARNELLRYLRVFYADNWELDTYTKIGKINLTAMADRMSAVRARRRIAPFVESYIGLLPFGSEALSIIDSRGYRPFTYYRSYRSRCLTYIADPFASGFAALFNTLQMRFTRDKEPL